jgi:serine protease Do
MKKRNIFLVGTVLLIGIIVGVALTARFRVQEIGLADKTGISGETLDFLGKLNASLTEVVEAVKPSVVNISTTKTVRNPLEDFFDHPLFERFFGEEFGFRGPHPREFRTSSLGSGVIVSSDGYILTNNHVIEDAEEIEVTLFDERTLKGKVVGTDPKSDLAVIKVEAQGLPAAKFGSSAGLKVGEVVIAIGVPFGLSHTTTMGIVSAVGRSNVGIAEYEDFIQTDAAINPGNSGGAMVNIRGELVGINTAIFSTSGGYMGIGFAIPSDMAKSVLQSIIEHGKVIRGWLGVTIQSLTPELAEQFGIEEQKGAVVTDVLEDSPARKGGLERGDVIVEFAGREVESSVALKNMAAESPPDSTVEIKVLRDGKEKVLSVTLGEYPEKLATAQGGGFENALRGVNVREITPEIRESLDIPEGVNGVIVAGLDPGSPAQGAIARNDVLREINRKEIRDLKDYREAASRIGPRESVLLLVYRQGRNLYLTIRP